MTTYTGKNVELAAEKAAKALGVQVSDLKYDILAGKSGGYALIQVIETTSIPSTGQWVESLSGDAVEEATTATKEEKAPRGERSNRRNDKKRGRNSDRSARSDRSDRSDRRRKNYKQRDEELVVVPQDGPTEVTVGGGDKAALSELGQSVQDYLVKTLELLGFGVEVQLGEREEEIYADLISEHYHDVFIARDMELLNALELLVDKAVLGFSNAEASDELRKKFVLDSNGHRARLDLELTNAAYELSTRALDEGRMFKIGPLSPRDRRVVHLALREVSGVKTRSEGEGVFRRVCIIPVQTPEDEDGEE